MINNVYDWFEYDAVSRNLSYPKKKDFETTYYYNKGEMVYIQSPGDPDPSDFTKYGAKEKVVDEEAFLAAKEEYRVKRETLEKLFITYLFIHLGISDHPKRYKLYELSNEYSSDRSYQDIAMNAEDLAQLLV